MHLARQLVFLSSPAIYKYYVAVFAAHQDFGQRNHPSTLFALLRTIYQVLRMYTSMRHFIIESDTGRYGRTMYIVMSRVAVCSAPPTPHRHSVFHVLYLYIMYWCKHSPFSGQGGWICGAPGAFLGWMAIYRSCIEPAAVAASAYYWYLYKVHSTSTYKYGIQALSRFNVVHVCVHSTQYLYYVHISAGTCTYSAYLGTI